MHRRVLCADVGELAFARRFIGPKFHGADFSGIEDLFVRGGVRHDIFVLPDHGVAGGDCEVIRNKRKTLDEDYMGLSRSTPGLRHSR